MESITDTPRRVNNGIYSELGARWYDADDDPVALLRAESRFRNPWVAAEIERCLGGGPRRVLDIGCGAGFLANDLATRGHQVVGLDAAPEALDVARGHDTTGTARYLEGDATALPFPPASFDVVCAMDFLEHVTSPEAVVAEVGRVLAPGGVFFFHTFNRNRLAWLVIIKGVEWFVRNTPPDMHVLNLFLKPDEVAAMCRSHEMERVRIVGTRPRFGRPFWQMLLTGVVPRDFAFTFTDSTLLAYSGWARKKVQGGSDPSCARGVGP